MEKVAQIFPGICKKNRNFITKNNMAEVKNVIEGLTEEILRVTEIHKTYLELPDNAGAIGARLMELVLDRAKQAQGRGDVIEMMMAFKALQEFEL